MGGGVRKATRTLEKECPLEQRVLSHCWFHFYVIHPVQYHVSHQRFFSSSFLELDLLPSLSGTLEIWGGCSTTYRWGAVAAGQRQFTKFTGWVFFYLLKTFIFIFFVIAVMFMRSLCVWQRPDDFRNQQQFWEQWQPTAVVEGNF